MNEICPVTSLPVQSHPEWTDLCIAEQYHVTFKKLGNDILLNLPCGNMTYYDSDRYFDFRNRVIEQAFPQGGCFVDIKSYVNLTGTPPFKERQKLMRHLLNDAHRCKGYLIYGQSRLVNLIFKTAVAMMGKLPYPAKSLSNYEAAVLFAVNLMKIQDTSISDLSSAGFFSKKEWHFKNPESGTGIDFMVSNDNILFTRFFGRGSTEELVHIERILDILMRDEFISSGYTRISEFVNFSAGSFSVRKGYTRILNDLHRKYNYYCARAYICNNSPILKLLLLIGAPSVKIELLFVKDPLTAVAAIRKPRIRKKRSEKKYTITDSDVNSLISMVSLIAWDADSKKPLFKPCSPLRQIETTLELVKKDRQVIFSEIESKNNDLKTAIEELKKARDDAEAATIAKGQFLANMSHELRTPLNGVIGSAELLKETKLNEEQMQFVSIIHKSSVHLLAVINDILDYSKIESGQIRLEEIPFEYSVLIDDVISIVNAQANDKKVPVIVDFDASVEKKLTGDPFRLKQILLNLLQNAIKFTAKGQIHLTIKVISGDDALQHVSTEISDTGIGIEEQKISQLFNQFAQADSSTTRRFGGTGLGLVIVKQLTELMSGKVSVQSTPGTGSTFTFTIPLKKTGSSQTCHQSGTLLEFDIVILSQNEFEREWYKTKAISSGGKVLYCGNCFENGIEVYSKHKMHNRDAICIVDTGFENADPVPLLNVCLHAHRKVIYIRTSQGIHYRETSLSDNCILINKPLKIFEFEKVLHRCFENDFSGENVKIINNTANTSDISRYSILLVEDSPTNQIVATKLLQKIGCPNITTCNNGKEALQVLENEVFDLIFMDCQMPELDGFATTETIRDKRSNVKDHETFIIAFTAHAMQEEIQKCFSAGMNDYILKPVTIDSLKAVLKRWDTQKRTA
ncbi:MAG: response regulator [Chitinispirillaceae bacterium]|nr:response regulator [Chitinispirillaceae bacterium]